MDHLSKKVVLNVMDCQGLVASPTNRFVVVGEVKLTSGVVGDDWTKDCQPFNAKDHISTLERQNIEISVNLLALDHQWDLSVNTHTLQSITIANEYIKLRGCFKLKVQ